MGLFDFLKRKKQNGGAAPEIDADDLMRLDDIDPEEIDPPETRFTEEYEDFLAEQEAEERSEECRDGALTEEAPEEMQ